MRRCVASILLAAVAVLGASEAALADSRDPIRGYRVKATPQNLEKLALAGFDVTEGRRDDGTVEIFGTADQVRKFAAGEDVRVTRVPKGASAKQAKARLSQAAQYTGSDAGWNVWTRYDRVPGDGKEQYLEQYDRLAQQSIVKRVVIGTSHLGRDIVALKVTKDAKRVRDNSRPAVLYNAMQHAREWLAGETCRRSLDFFVDNYGSDAQVTRLVDTRELWFVCVANPDGYEYTFTPGNRLWRKNMADNDGDGVRGESNDGVDPNRNFPASWGMDNEGSSPDPSSETYRGTGPASEPETKAMLRLWERVDFEFQKNDHTAAELLLYPQGNQIFTRTADHSIFTALAGSDGEASAIKDDEEQFDPDLGAELYITNGDTLDTAYNEEGILAYTPEGTVARDPNVTGFEFEDDEQEVEEEWLRHKAFTLDLAESADDPANPESHLGNTVKDFYVDTFEESYGDPQQVQVTAKRSLGKVVMKYQVNGGRTRTAQTKRFRGGERHYQERGAYFQRLRGTVRGTEPGDEVKVWFESRRGATSDSFTYSAEADSRNRVLVLAAENRTGSNPGPPVGGPPQYLSYYTEALDELGVGYDVFDTDQQGNHSADWLGVLSHYDLVVWYTGDDFLTRMPTQPGGTGFARLAVEQMVDARDYMNEGGKLFFTGQNAGFQYSLPTLVEFRNFDFPEGDEGPGGRWCDGDPFQQAGDDGCIPPNNDFLQYWLGAAVYVSGGTSTDPDGNLLDVLGVAPPFEPLRFSLNGPDSAENQYHSATLGITSSMLPPEEFPTFASEALGVWDRKGAAGPFQPTSGTQYAFSGADNAAFKRLRQEIDLTGKTSAELRFNTSYLLEEDWDFMAVEVHEVGTDDWTTLPDANGHTSQSTGASTSNSSCGNGWSDGVNPLHPFLGHYQRLNPADAHDGCDPEGTTGEWHGTTGHSDGWEEWRIDLSDYAGKKIEVAISVITDWGTLDMGVFVDDIAVIADGATLNETQLEGDFGAWTVGPPPDETPNPTNGWVITTELFEEAPLVGTRDSAYAAFGFEAIEGADSRSVFMEKVIRHVSRRGR